jgi:hypothetical protein
MTRITGLLTNADGPINGRLYCKPSRQFLGAPAKGFSFLIANGVIDIKLPSNPPGTCWMAGWCDKFQTKAVEYTERWIVPWTQEVDIDELRSGALSGGTRARRTETLDNTLWKVEAQQAKEEKSELEKENARLLQRLTAAESRAMASAGKVASLDAELRRMQRKSVEAELPEVQEKIIEKQVLPDDMRQMLSDVRRQIIVLQDENKQLKEQAEAGISASTHLSNLQAEVDRLRIEKQHLLNRIEELKQPRRSTSSLRREMIANLDKLIEG